ncbi:MAG: DUF6167 family protein [Actinomycetes bacterium]
MRRVFWVALGATAGVLVVRRLGRAADSFTPQGLVGALGGLGDGLRVFAEEVRAGMAERETELRDALGLDAQRDVPPAEAADLTMHPTRAKTGEDAGR